MVELKAILLSFSTGNIFIGADTKSVSKLEGKIEERKEGKVTGSKLSGNQILSSSKDLLKKKRKHKMDDLCHIKKDQGLI